MTDQMDHTIEDVVAKTHRQDQLLLGLVGIIFALTAALAWGVAEINQLTDVLTRRTEIITHIEATSQQQVCADTVEVAYEAAIARVVLAAINGDDAAVAATHSGLFAALEDLDRIDELCPPVTAEIKEDP